MGKIFISQPLRDKSDIEIMMTRQRFAEFCQRNGHEPSLQLLFSENYKEALSAEDDAKHIPVWFLGRAITRMAKCDGVWFAKGWEDARGCVVEHEVAVKYGIPCYYEGE